MFEAVREHLAEEFLSHLTTRHGFNTTKNDDVTAGIMSLNKLQFFRSQNYKYLRSSCIYAKEVSIQDNITDKEDSYISKLFEIMMADNGRGYIVLLLAAKLQSYVNDDSNGFLVRKLHLGGRVQRSFYGNLCTGS